MVHIDYRVYDAKGFDTHNCRYHFSFHFYFVLHLEDSESGFLSLFPYFFLFVYIISVIRVELT